MANSNFDEFHTGSMQPDFKFLEQSKRRKASSWEEEFLSSFDQSILEKAATHEEKDTRRQKVNDKKKGPWDRTSETITRAKDIRDDSERNSNLKSKPKISNNDAKIMKEAKELIAKGNKPKKVIKELIDKNSSEEVVPFISKFANVIAEMYKQFKEGKVKEKVVAENIKEGAEKEIPSSISLMSNQKEAPHKRLKNKAKRKVKPQDDVQLLIEAKEKILNGKNIKEIVEDLTKRYGKRANKFYNHYKKTLNKFAKSKQAIGQTNVTINHVSNTTKSDISDTKDQQKKVLAIKKATKISIGMLAEGKSHNEIKNKVSKEISPVFASKFCTLNNLDIITAKQGFLDAEKMEVLQEIAASARKKLGKSPDFGDRKRATKVLQMFKEQKIADKQLVDKHLKALNTDSDNNRAIVRAFMTNYKRALQKELKDVNMENMDFLSIYGEIPMENSDMRYF